MENGTYLVTFRNKKTLETIISVKVTYDKEVISKTPSILCLAALEELTERGEKSLPDRSKSTWSWKEL